MFVLPMPVTTGEQHKETRRSQEEQYRHNSKTQKGNRYTIVFTLMATTKRQNRLRPETGLGIDWDLNYMLCALVVLFILSQ